MKILPKTKLGQWSVGLIIIMPLLIYLGGQFVNVYQGVSAGKTIFEDIIVRPGVALFMLFGFAFGIAAFITGLITLIKNKERALLVFISTLLGFLLILFLSTEIVPHSEIKDFCEDSTADYCL